MFATNKGTIPYGWHEFLELCEYLGAEPYLPIPIVFSDTEAANLIEYLSGPVTSPYGSKRAAHGHVAPWTDSFTRIHLELGNEAWNPIFRGGTLLAADYGKRGNDFFGIVRQSPYYSAKLDLVLGVQATNPFNARVTHNASVNHDTLAIGPYIATRIDDFATNEQLYGSLFAEASWWSSPAVGTPQAGPVRQMYDMVNSTNRPVPLMVYEVNLHTTQGSITQRTGAEAARQNSTAGVGAASNTRGIGGAEREVGITGMSVGGATQNSRSENALGGERRQPGQAAGGVEGTRSDERI